jgi:xanthine dehydrogenase accessory factor
MEDNPEQAASQSIIKAIEDVLERRAIAALVTVIDSNERIGAKLLLDETGESTGSLRDPLLDAVVARQAAVFLATREETRAIRVNEFAPDISSGGATLLLFERIHNELRLVICGAGHVGASLAKLGGFIGYQTTLIDDRADFVRRERFPDEGLELILADNWGNAVRKAIGDGKGVAVAVVTRGHNEDEECMQAIISTDADYVGLIGSRRRTNIVLDRLREAGAEDGKLRQVRAPVGLDLGAVTPEEVALAILAEIVAEQRGAKGGSLSAWRREKGLS